MLSVVMDSMEPGETTLSESVQTDIMVKYLLGSTQSKLMNSLKKNEKLTKKLEQTL